MKKAVITILGIQNPAHRDNGDPYVQNYQHQASYYFENESRTTKKYYNTLPLLIEKYADEYKVVPVYTDISKEFNQDVLEHAKLSCEFNDDLGYIEDEKNYSDIFSKIDATLNKYDKVIIDLTHGFRHLPILTIIDVIIQNLKAQNKIEKILFAKEIVKHTPKESGEYEIIDLKNYLEIATLTFILTTFNQSYVVLHNSLADHKIVKSLQEFSKHFMANSLEYLINNENSLIERIITELEEHDEVYYSEIIKEIIINLKEILKLKNQAKYLQLFGFAKIMRKRGYYLNAITLLNEAIAWYCVYSLSNISEDFAYLSRDSKDTYKLSSNAKTIVNFSFKPRKQYKNDLNLPPKELKEVMSKIKNIQHCEKFGKDFIDSSNDLRNNLAHANSGGSIESIENLLETQFGKFTTYIIEKDILNSQN